ncbi:IclR family transcriptional regulator [Gordonia sp. CPCC 205515]|uniref:IclR family transcriptional regulator n=1 Tax=Gordonia sp. CPCC 205515 TaxID=3140791 RepID=UPI003AF37E77
MTVVDCADTQTVPPSMVARMTLILDAFDSPSARLNLEEIARRTHLPRSTTHRILDQLVGLEWLDHRPPGYVLGRRALGVGGGGEAAHAELRQAAAEGLLDLHLRTGMVVHLAAWDGRDEVYLDKVGGRLAMSLRSRIGARRPAHTTTGGRAMLACHKPEDVDMLLRGRVGDEIGADGWDLVSLHRELHRVRRQRGLSFDRGEYTRAMTGRTLPNVAVAIAGPTGPVGAISLCGDERSPALERVAPLLVEVARRISAGIFPGDVAAARDGVLVAG